MNHVEVKKGDRFRAVVDIKTHGLTHWLRAPITGSFECTIPKGTILVVQNDPPVSAKGVYGFQRSMRNSSSSRYLKMKEPTRSTVAIHLCLCSMTSEDWSFEIHNEKH